MAGATDAAHLIGHVQDADYFEFPQFMVEGGHWYIPQPLEFLGIHLTKFMVLEVVAAVIIALVMIRIAALVKEGHPPRGRFWNFFEGILVFIRDEVARPAIGHDGDKFLPFLWTLFFFILICNLLGMLPWLGSPTGALGVTSAMAIITMAVGVGVGSAKMGVAGFWKAQVPHMDLPGPLKYLLVPMIFFIEVMGLFIKHLILAIRLLANMMAGHLVLAVILSFVAMSASSLAWYGVMPASILGAVALSLLELFVAFLQAYIFTFLSALFIGMAVHPH